MTGLAAVPGIVLDELARARRGVVVLGVDGLGYRPAVLAWRSAVVARLTSTVPSTSATAWLTALTGAEPAEHGVPGMVYRVGDALVYAVTGEVLAGELGPSTRAGPGDGAPPLVRPVVNVFERARVRCLAIGRELAHLPGPWAASLLRGTEPAADPPPPPAELARQAGDPFALVDAVAREVAAALESAERAALLWVYVNLDDYVHANGYDDAVLAALHRLDERARRWAAAGWTVLAHSDHGQVPVRPDPALADAWDRIDDPNDCILPGGGAGRIRWLHPRPGREDVIRRRLAEALGDTAAVTTPERLGLPPDRTGAVVALARCERFPIPDRTLRFEHGALHPDELDIPLAVWRTP